MTRNERACVRLPWVAGVLLLLGCGGPPSPPSAGPQASELARGAELWAATCDRCHNLRPPRQFTAEEWPVIVSHMRTRADLTRSQARAVAAYLRQATAEGSGGG